MTATYDLISEQVLSSAASSVTFSSIPQGFKDLVLECVMSSNSGGVTYPILRFNGDTGANYSYTYLNGNGSTAQSGRGTTFFIALVTPSLGMNVLQIMSYSNTNVFKTVLNRSSQDPGNIGADVALWRSTAAITSLSLDTTSFQAGNIFRLYGIVG